MVALENPIILNSSCKRVYQNENKLIVINNKIYKI